MAKFKMWLESRRKKRKKSKPVVPKKEEETMVVKPSLFPPTGHNKPSFSTGAHQQGQKRQGSGKNQQRQAIKDQES